MFLSRGFGKALAGAALGLLATGYGAGAVAWAQPVAPTPLVPRSAAAGGAFDVCAVVPDATIARAGFDPRTRAAPTLMGHSLPGCTFSGAGGATIVELSSQTGVWPPQLPSGWIGNPITVNGRQGFLEHPTTNPGCSVVLRDVPEVVSVTYVEYNRDTCADARRAAGIIESALP